MRTVSNEVLNLIHTRVTLRRILINRTSSFWHMRHKSDHISTAILVSQNYTTWLIIIQVHFIVTINLNHDDDAV